MRRYANSSEYLSTSEYLFPGRHEKNEKYFYKKTQDNFLEENSLFFRDYREKGTQRYSGTRGQMF